MLKRKNNVIIEAKTFKKRPMKYHFRATTKKLALEGGTFPTLLDILDSDVNELNVKRTLLVENEARKKHDIKGLL